MPIRRTTAPLPNRQRRKRQKRKQDLKWLDSQVQQQRPWTQFSYPLHRLQYCYNLNPDVFLQIREAYLKGKPGDFESNPPKSTDRIRQDIVASILIIGYGLSRSEFVTAKQLATKRNTRRSASPDQEKKLWPPRPDIFLLCSKATPFALSDEDIADFFRYEFFSDKLAEIEVSSSESESPELPPSELANGTLLRVQREQSIDEEPVSFDDPIQPSVGSSNSSTHGQSSSSSFQASGRGLNSIRRTINRSVALLKDLCLTIGEWGPVAETQRRYVIGRSKANEVRSAVKSLKDGKIEGVTWSMFVDTFEDEDLMQMPLQKTKEESIRQVVSLFNAD